MIRRSQGFLTQLYVLADSICIFVIFLFAWWLKFQSGLLEYEQPLPFKSYFLWGSIYAFLSIVLGYLFRLYSPKRKRNFSYEVLRVIQVQVFSLFMLLSLLYLFKEIDISRSFLAIFFISNIAGVSLYRYGVKLGLWYLREKGYNKQFILILGAGSLGRGFYDNLENYPELGFEVVGFLDDMQIAHDPDYAHYKPILGRIEQLEEVLNQYTIDEVIIALPLAAHKKYAQIISMCDKAGVKALIIPDFFDLLPSQPYFDQFAGMPLINVRDIPLDELSNRILKRGFDIAFSIMVILITSPLLLLIALGIKLTSPGPVLFKQERVGLNRRTFMMYKFRSMRVQAEEESNTKWTISDDPRRTKFGSFLRSTSLDELPQFFNVLIGNMSVVGPRPERPYFVDQFKEEIPRYMVKHHVRPGITGWAQMNGYRGDTSIKKRIDHDLFYLENWTFLLDLKIILKTIVHGFRNKNAY